MVAVPDVPCLLPFAVAAPDRHRTSARHHRAVAVAVTAMELLRPESDLARLLDAFAGADVLLAADDIGEGSVHALDPAATVPDDLDNDDLDHAGDDVRGRAAELGLRELRLHRLGLTPPEVTGAEGDLVAAMSELVGFDPEPGVYCLAPTAAPGDPARTAVERAAQRIAQVYGIPLLRYRCLELSLVDPA